MTIVVPYDGTDLSTTVHDIAPDSEFEYEVVDPYPQAGMIASKIRSYAKTVDADTVVRDSLPLCHHR